MNREEIKKTIVDIIVDHHPALKSMEMKEESNFYFDLALDSLDLIEIGMDVEKEYRIEITEAEAERINTFGQLLDLVEKKVTQNS